MEHTSALLRCDSYTVSPTPSEVYDLGGFRIFTRRWSRHHHPVLEHFITPERSPSAVTPQPPAPSPWEPRIRSQCPWIGLLWTLVYTEPWICVLSHPAPSAECHPGRGVGRCPVPIMIGSWSTAVVHCMGGHSGGFHIRAMTNSAAVNIHVLVFLWICVHFCWVWTQEWTCWVEWRLYVSAVSCPSCSTLHPPDPEASEGPTPHILPDTRHHLSCSMGASGWL